MLWDKSWSWNVFQTLVKFTTKKGRPKELNRQLQPFNMSQWNPRKENTCHPAVITLLPLPMVNPEETLRIQDYRPLGSCAVLSLVIQSCPTLCDPMNCSLLGSSVCGILQARILEWVSVPFSRGSSQPRDRTQVSCIAGGFLKGWATKEAPR